MVVCKCFTEDKILKSKNGFIELMRFICAINVLLFHSLFAYNSVLFNNGWIGVEYFFILTGFFLTKKADETNNQVQYTSIGNDTINVLYKKFIRVFPTQFVSFIPIFILLCFIEKPTFLRLIYNFINSLPNLFMIDMTGIWYYSVFPYGWYMSVMFIAMAFIYPLLRKHYDYMTKVFFPLGGVLILCWILKTYGSIVGIVEWTGIAYKGTFRGFADIMIGCAAYEITKLINKTDFTVLGKRVIAFLEIIGYISLLVFTNFNLEMKTVVMVIIFTALSVAITFSNKSVLSSIFTGKLFVIFGELSLPIYLNQYFGITIGKQILNNYAISGKIVCLLILVITIILSIINVTVVKFINCKKVSLIIKKEELK